jgi:hypothetical protein
VEDAIAMDKVMRDFLAEQRLEYTELPVNYRQRVMKVFEVSAYTVERRCLVSRRPALTQELHGV